MAPGQEAAYRIGFQLGLLFGAFVGGAIVGLLPLIVSLRRGRRTFAFASWASCIAGSMILGIFLSVPVAIVLTVIVLCLERRGAPGAVHSPHVESARNLYEAAPVRVPQREEQAATRL